MSLPTAGTRGEVSRFVLPPELGAGSPPEARGLARDEVRLLVSFKEKDGVAHARFTDLPGFLKRGELLVVNDSAPCPPRSWRAGRTGPRWL